MRSRLRPIFCASVAIRRSMHVCVRLYTSSLSLLPPREQEVALVFLGFALPFLGWLLPLAATSHLPEWFVTGLRFLRLIVAKNLPLDGVLTGFVASQYSVQCFGSLVGVRALWF